METAREATAEDLDGLSALAELAHAERLEERGGPEWSERSDPTAWTHVGLDARIQARGEMVVVGLIDDSSVGLGRCRVEVLPSGKKVGVIEELFVLAEARGVGVGEAMMNLLLEWCRGESCAAVESVALPGNRAAKNFFERFGLVARAIVVKRDLQQ